MADASGETVKLPNRYHIKVALVRIGHEPVQFRPPVFRARDSDIHVFSSDSPAAALAVFRVSEEERPLREQQSTPGFQRHTKNSVSGVQVHDARLAAAMYVHGVSHIFTLNVADFSRFDGLTALHPDSVKAYL